MGRSWAAETATRCVHCGKPFVPSSESNTPSGKFCSGVCYRRWVRMKVRHALGAAAGALNPVPVPAFGTDRVGPDI